MLTYIYLYGVTNSFCSSGVSPGRYSRPSTLTFIAISMVVCMCMCDYASSPWRQQNYLMGKRVFLSNKFVMRFGTNERRAINTEYGVERSNISQKLLCSIDYSNRYLTAMFDPIILLCILCAMFVCTLCLMPIVLCASYVFA